MTTHSKLTAAKKTASFERQKAAQQIQTRDKIIAAATRVFAAYPYHSASIRMIGKAAGVDHPLINYYFPTKSVLFEAVLQTETEKYFLANIEWFNGIQGLGPEKGLSLYLDRFFAFAIENPEALRIITLNLAQPEKSAIIPGYQQIQDFFAKTADTFMQTVPLDAAKREIKMFTTNFNTLAINYLGADTYYAGIMGMAPGSREYLEWVKENMMYLFLPQLREIVGG